MSKTKIKKAHWLGVFIISIFSFGSFAFAYTAITGNSVLGMVSQANDGEDDSEDENEDEDKDENEDEDEKEDKEDEYKKEVEKKAKEEAKKKAEYQRELLKKKSEYQREQLKKKAEYLRKMEGKGGDDLDENEDENETESDDDGEESKDDDKKADLLEDINEDIIEAEERIARAQAEGIDVTKALATLATAKEKAALADKELTTTSYEALRTIAREVKKLAHFASHKDVKSARDIDKDIDKIAKRIAQAKGKISLLESLGGNPETFTNSLSNLEADFAALKTKLAAGGQDQIDALSQVEPLERKVKVLKNSIESAVYALGGTDERYDDDYENEVEDIYEDLNDVAEIEGDEIGTQIKNIADAQKGSVDKVARSVENIDKRSQILQLLFGAKTKDVEELENEITANKARIEALSQTASQIEDQEVKNIVLEQINNLTQETSKLETFVSGQKDRLSAFGWFVNLF